MVKTISELKTDDLFINMFEIPIYDNHICFIRYKNDSAYEQALSFVEEIGIDTAEFKIDDYKNACGFTKNAIAKNGGRVIFLFINKSEEYSDDYINTLSHETYHLIQFIMKHNGLKSYKDSDNEHIAYLTGYLFNVLHKF